ncbi:Metallo-dependent phosphatase-like protein [Paraphysoderma sedebokerense]|nr:Metallo-dependent phosphatase-like protein [Paraphysoderma sedebokerense]
MTGSPALSASATEAADIIKELSVQVSPADQEKAETLKEEANKLFLSKKFEDAICKYDEAVAINPNNPAYYSNRAFAYIKTEGFGFAVRDAEKAIALDPTFIKAYYRRASANMALMKFKEALKDFKAVVKYAPQDPDAKRKLNECIKVVRKMEFENAIAADDLHTSAIAKLGNLDEMIVEPSYDGPKLPEVGISLEFVEEMIETFRNQKKLHKKYAYKIMVATKEIFEKLSSLVEIKVPEGATLTVCGDVHGQFYDLLNIFKLNGLPSPTNMYLFNGDFVDRGSFSVEVMLTLLAFKWLYPNAFFLSRGNHETDDMNKVYGFEGEVKAKYSDTAMKVFSELFNAIPLCNVINEKIIVVHGGLFSRDDVTLDDIRKIDRFRQPGNEGLMCELLWSDPQPEPGRGPSKRGVGFGFGPDVTDNFLKRNGLELLIRSHEVKQEGYVIEHNGKCVTVFSAPNYWYFFPFTVTLVFRM